MEYFKDLNLLKSKRNTKIITSEGFEVTGSDITFDNQNNIIKSSASSIILDKEKNKIYLESFEYSTTNKFLNQQVKLK